MTDQIGCDLSWKVDRTTTWLIIPVCGTTKIKKDNNVDDHIGPLYVENEIELS